MGIRSRCRPMLPGVLTAVVVTIGAIQPAAAAPADDAEASDAQILDTIRDTAAQLTPLRGPARDKLVASARGIPISIVRAADWDGTSAYRLSAGRAATITPLGDTRGAVAVLFDADGTVAHHIETSLAPGSDGSAAVTTRIDARPPMTRALSADRLRAAARDIAAKEILLGPGCWAVAATAILATLLVVILIPLNMIPFFGGILFGILAAALLMSWIPVIPACLGL
ncbi:hypothetical protein [Nocardia sp. NPDC051570]|uniref:hypothetical protein n=1 Tax=Nocardia sp. NPDC051570 TaxID=3364324 RepID=UPI0037BB7353